MGKEHFRRGKLNVGKPGAGERLGMLKEHTEVLCSWIRRAEKAVN